jgi:hypothetical protein
MKDNQTIRSFCLGLVTSIAMVAVQALANPNDATTTTLASSANPAIAGETVTLTATVAAGAEGAAIPTGTVRFSDGTKVLGTVDLNSSGSAVQTVANLPLGAHLFIAEYDGDTSYSPSQGSVLNQVITRPNSTVTLTSSSNPARLDEDVTLTAKVMSMRSDARIPTGSIGFKEGKAMLAMMSLVAGEVSFTTKMQPGSHLLSAVYYGDGAFNQSSSDVLTQVVTTVTTPPPMITEFPADAIYSCADFVMAANDSLVKARSECDGKVTISHAADEIDNGVCANRCTIKRVYTATDACGSSSSRMQTITINDTQGPVFAKIPADLTVTNGAVPAAKTLEAVDNCDGNPEVVFNETSATGAKGRKLVLTRTWTATDACGNSTRAVQKITVVASGAQASR